MITSDKKSKNIVELLKRDYPQFHFRPGNQEHWSPKKRSIIFNADQPAEKLNCGLLHELAHALLDHSSYNSDFELIKLETEAWHLAAEVGKKYGVKISQDHIQNCLDTYRDWLHRRSACPRCSTHVLQKDARSYQCYNCQTTWQVSSGRFVRPYRRTLQTI